MKKTFAIIFPLSLLLMAGCTLTPPKGGEDLLDTEHKTQHQDPVTVPSGPYTASIPAHAAIAETAKADTAPKKLTPEKAEPEPVKSAEIASAKAVEAKPEIKEVVKEEAKVGPKPEPKAEIKPEAKTEIPAEVKVQAVPVKAEESKTAATPDGMVIENEIKTKSRTPVSYADIKNAEAPKSPPAEAAETKAADVKPAEVAKEAVKEIPKAPEKITPVEDCAPMPAPPPGGMPVLPKLKAGDKVKVTVAHEDDMTGTYTLDENGAFVFPLLGKVFAKDMTSAALQGIMTSRLANGYLVNPEVRVEFSSDCKH